MTNFVWNVLLLLLLLISFVSVSQVFGLTQRAQNDLITKLPGLVFNTNYKQYSGYLKPSPRKNLHYWLTESQGNPSKDPLILWFNGGPGCSSLEGLITELGPFHVNKDGATLWENVYGWNKVGNVIFLEAPTGVGFSYSQPQNDTTNDWQTAIDNYNALQDFFTNVFPEYQNRDFYITGESYAGIYIPTLTSLIVDGMNNGTFKGNLKGIAIGNGYMSNSLDTNSVIDYLYFHGFIGDDLWSGLYKTCCEGTCEASCDFDKAFQKNVPSACGNMLDEVINNWYGSQNDAYNVYQDCYGPVNAPSPAQSRFMADLKRFHAPIFAAASGNNAANVNYNSTDANNGFSCFGDPKMHVYLNRPDVWSALHIPTALTSRVNFTWNGCSDFPYTETLYETYPIFSHIYTKSNIRILIYNGDVDTVCNFMSDEWLMTNFTKSWNIQRTKARYPWYFRGQIGGYVQSYPKIDVATVKGAGHFVPTSRPGPALQMITNFIHNTGDYSQPSGYSTKQAPLISTNQSPKFSVNL